MSDENRRRAAPMSEQVMGWLTRAAVGLGLFFLSQIYLDIQTMKTDVTDLKVKMAVVQERTSHRREATP